MTGLTVVERLQTVVLQRQIVRQALIGLACASLDDPPAATFADIAAAASAHLARTAEGSAMLRAAFGARAPVAEAAGLGEHTLRIVHNDGYRAPLAFQVAGVLLRLLADLETECQAATAELHRGER